jgi:hypothetical protein
VNSLALVGNGPPVLRAAMTGASLGTNGFNVLSPSRHGRVYRLEYNISLTETNWSPLPLKAGNGQLLRFTDPGASSIGQRFYRIRQW